MPFVRTALLAATLALASTVALPSTASAQACSWSGPYTDKLCPGDYMLPGHYLYSPGDVYRFYYQGDGGGVVYQWIGGTLTPIYTVITPNSNPGYATYTDSYPGLSEQLVFFANNGSGSLYYLQGGGTTGVPDGENFLRLDSDGCLRGYDRGGARYLLRLVVNSHCTS